MLPRGYKRYSSSRSSMRELQSSESSESEGSTYSFNMQTTEEEDEEMRDEYSAPYDEGSTYSFHMHATEEQEEQRDEYNAPYDEGSTYSFHMHATEEQEEQRDEYNAPYDEMTPQLPPSSSRPQTPRASEWQQPRSTRMPRVIASVDVPMPSSSFTLHLPAYSGQCNDCCIHGVRRSVVNQGTQTAEVRVKSRRTQTRDVQRRHVATQIVPPSLPKLPLRPRPRSKYRDPRKTLTTGHTQSSMKALAN